jgi:DNA repair protein RecO (recombination protein O)
MLIFLACRRVDIGTQMPLRETEAIVLRTYRLGEADKVASLLTRQLGRLRAVAAGAQRPKSRYGGTLEPLSYVRLLVFERENRDLLRLNSVELIESFFDMQKDYRVQVAAQYVAEVSEKFLPEREVNERAFRLLVAVLRALKRSGEINRPLVYFDYWLLRLGGFLPDLDRCSACGRGLSEGQGWYGEGSEGILCGDCRMAGTRETVSTDSLDTVRRGCKASLADWLIVEKPATGSRQVRRFFEEVVESHLEKKLITRPLLSTEV